MAIGVVIKMHNGWVDTPNNGTLRDLATNIEYQFHRPDYTGTGEPPKWGVQVHDLVSFTLVEGTPTNVTIYKKYSAGFVYSQLN